ncbi:hypothetical protein IM816_00455 [Luteibacter flocculans]|uniref:Uncharacterized protein n=1 Tax=Luteibacter flocculans TaxID=2780091 RepID=A0ABY4T112_9GAMM|nr:hypothetical protein [Luteibacter flocculans]URL58649.1 hypothetical protein IM816_00455 [Luteibacter flocculans]
MQNDTKKRDYGSSDAAQLRSLASRGVNVPQPTRPPVRESRRERPASRGPGRSRSAESAPSPTR